MGRDKRLEYAASFENCYFFRLLYYAGTQYPIMGALRWNFLECCRSSAFEWSQTPCDFPFFFLTCTSMFQYFHFIENVLQVLLMFPSFFHRMSYPYPYELYKRVDKEFGKEEYVLLSTYPTRPTSDEVNNAFLGKPRWIPVNDRLYTIQTNRKESQRLKILLVLEYS